MKKVLYLSNSPKTICCKIKGINSFNFTAHEAILSLGMEYHGNTFLEETVGYNKEDNVHLHLVQIYRNPFSRDVIVAYKQLMQLLKEEQFDIIHCNTPIGGFLGRICGKKNKVPKIIYQAHGFHFYKGAPLFNWLFFYPIERWLSRYTDALITINTEDYRLAKKRFHLKEKGKVFYVPGVGIDLSSFFILTKEMRKNKRAELGLNDKDIVIISAGRLDKNKNNATTLKALTRTQSNVKLLVCGEGEEEKNLIALTDTLKIKDRVLFLGNRTDIKELYQVADIFVLASYREGLSRSIMEAMASGLPCVVSRIRGNIDLVTENEGGYLFSPGDVEVLASKVNDLVSSDKKRNLFSFYNLNKIKQYDTTIIVEKLKEIYKDINVE